ncbi:hypothetical protein C8J57DRAFT_1244559 [Mycena rebaudengoi]|nr:hypothetical protein C8J57DRAFT_1244559 [Mycena rebaudengoi]
MAAAHRVHLTHTVAPESGGKRTRAFATGFVAKKPETKRCHLPSVPKEGHRSRRQKIGRDWADRGSFGQTRRIAGKKCAPKHPAHPTFQHASNSLKTQKGKGNLVIRRFGKRPLRKVRMHATADSATNTRRRAASELKGVALACTMLADTAASGLDSAPASEPAPLCEKTQKKESESKGGVVIGKRNKRKQHEHGMVEHLEAEYACTAANHAARHITVASSYLLLAYSKTGLHTAQSNSTHGENSRRATKATRRKMK